MIRIITSAYANKWIKSLEEEKAFLVNKEAESNTYIAAVNEEPMIPDYDYAEVAAAIEQLDEKIASLKHALNLANATARVSVNGTEMSVDKILIRMAQLNKRKSILDAMRKQLPKTRVDQRYTSRTVPEYQYINYDLELIRQEYDRISRLLMDLQMALDLHNQTVQFEVDL